MENISAMIANLGFPIAVSIYLLIRIEGKMQALTDSMNYRKIFITLNSINGHSRWGAHFK